MSNPPGAFSQLTRGEFWLRLLFMLLFAMLLQVAVGVMWVVVLVQLGCVVISGSTNASVLNFGKSLSTYIYQIWLFLSYNSEDKPFPFNDWPQDHD